MLYFQDNLIHIQTNSDQLSSKNTPTHTEVPNTFLDDGDSSCIYDITAMIRATTENNLKTLIAKRLGCRDNFLLSKTIEQYLFLIFKLVIRNEV